MPKACFSVKLQDTSSTSQQCGNVCTGSHPGEATTALAAGQEFSEDAFLSNGFLHTLCLCTKDLEDSFFRQKDHKLLVVVVLFCCWKMLSYQVMKFQKWGEERPQEHWPPGNCWHLIKSYIDYSSTWERSQRPARIPMHTSSESLQFSRWSLKKSKESVGTVRWVRTSSFRCSFNAVYPRPMHLMGFFNLWQITLRSPYEDHSKEESLFYAFHVATLM